MSETSDPGGANHSIRASKAPVSALAQEFGRRVRQRRLELNLSQEKLAELASLHWTFVGQVERGRRNLTLHNIVKIAKALGVDSGVLMQGLQDIDIPSDQNRSP